MPKNNNKKGKQKETPAAAPPPPPSAPPPQHAPPPPVMTIDTIEEEDDRFGEFGNMDADDLNDDSGEQADRVVDDPQDLNAWSYNDPQNSNAGWENDDQWETSAPSQTLMPPQPPPEVGGYRKSQKTQHAQHQHQHQHYQQHQQLQYNDGWGSGGGARGDAGNQATPTPAKKQNTKNTWSQTTQRAMEGPAWSTWGQEAGWAQGGDTEEIEEEEWSAEDDQWGPQPTAWTQQQSISTPQVYAQRQPTTSWQTWGEEARRLPKSQQPYADRNLPPGTGGYFHPQGGDKHWSQQQAAMTTAFRQQQEQAYALAQAQSLHRQQQQQQQIPQQEQAYAVVQAQNLHKQLQLPQQQQNRNQPQHEGKKYNKNKENKQQQQSKKERKRQQQQQETDVWGLGEGWQDLEDDPEDYEGMHDAWGRRVHFSPPHTVPSVAPSTVVENFTVNSFPPNELGLSTYNMPPMPSMPSKTLAYAYQGTATSLDSSPARNGMQDYADVRFIESKGAALTPVAGAFFGRNSRMAKDRFHWMFPPDKDERIASLLAWINSVSHSLGSFGLRKFLHTRERGALIVNADYRPVNSPSEPAFDWLTYPELQKTMDRTLQESVAFYDPSVLVVVFVFLPSKSGNSLAIWRRKIAVPNSIRLAYQAQITQAIAALRRDYVVHVDEIPPPKIEPPSLPVPPRKKRKWWKLWLSS